MFNLDESDALPWVKPRAAARISLFATFWAVASGSLVLLGWTVGVEVLKRVDLSFVAMNPLTALCLIISGIAIGLHHSCRPRAAIAVATVLTLIATAKMLDVAFGGLPVDRVLFSTLLDGPPGSLPNRMAPNSAVSFLFCGLALALVASERRMLQVISQVLGLAVLLISMFALIGYGFGIHELRGIGLFIPMALHTGAALLIVAAGIVALSRDVGLMLVLRDAGPAGVMARTVLPLAVAIPIVVGSMRLWGERHGYFGTEAGVALQVVASVAVTSALLVSSILALYRSDQSRKDREQALSRSEFFNRSINKASPDCVSLLDPDGNVLYVNDAVLRAYSLRTSAPLIGRPWGSLLDTSLGAERNAAMDVAREGGVGRIMLCLPDAVNEVRWFESLVSKLSDDEGRAIRFLVMSRDITLQRQAEAQVRWTAAHDALTKLPNRSLFQARLDQLSEHDGHRDFAILLLDIDDFKQVNDTLGHDAGDALLATVGERLRQAVRTEDFVARLGGDEFAIILEGVGSEAAATAAGEKILEALREPWIHSGRVGDCRTSIGVSVARLHGKDASELLKNADIALYVAKAQDRGRLAVFSPAMRAEMQTQSSKISLARYALRENLIAPFYQPKVDLKSGKLMGFEALLRWHHINHGVQLPASIDAAFGVSELAQELTDRILTQVLADLRKWTEAGIEVGHVAVNMAAADFKQKDFAEHLLERLDAAGVPRACLQIEVTETVFLGRGAEYVEHALKTLSAGGIRIALDDFGTGYASLSHLKQFPIDIVKIDRSFLKDIHDDQHNTAIIRTVVSLGRALDLDVVAEGVETADQEAYLIGHGCRLGQGYLYGKATPASGIPDLISSWPDRLSNAA